MDLEDGFPQNAYVIVDKEAITDISVPVVAIAADGITGLCYIQGKPMLGIRCRNGKITIQDPEG